MAFFKSGSDVMLSGDDYADMKNIIHTELIGTVKDDLKRSTESLINGVDVYWTGTAAESYKTYVDGELQRILALLDKVEENVTSNLTNIGADMQAMDSDLASQIKSLGDQIGSGGAR